MRENRLWEETEGKEYVRKGEERERKRKGEKEI